MNETEALLEGITVASIRAFPSGFARKAREVSQKIDGADFHVNDPNHRDAVRELAKMADLYEKAIDPEYKCAL